MDDALEAVIDGLFVVDPEGFVEARDAIVKQFKAEKRKDAAATVAAMRRPSPVVWAMNSVAREHPAQVQDLLRRGAAARAAQEALLSGGTVGVLHEAVEQRRVVIAELVSHAVSAMRGKGDALIPQLRAGFEAASIDPPQGSLLQQGRLLVVPVAGDDLSPFGMTAPRPTLKLVPSLTEPVEPVPPAEPATPPVDDTAVRQEQELRKQERQHVERLEQERLENERLENERIQQERLEQERLEQERVRIETEIGHLKAQISVLEAQLEALPQRGRT